MATKKTKMQKFTLKQFLEMFPDDDTCLEYIRNKKIIQNELNALNAEKNAFVS